MGSTTPVTGRSSASSHLSRCSSSSGHATCPAAISFPPRAGPIFEHPPRRRRAVPKVRFQIAMSLDGYVAGPNQSDENPLGEGGEELHDWIVSLSAWRERHEKQGGEVNESTRIVEESRANIGAAVMGRNMFGPPDGGDWGDEQWKGWW